MTGTVKQAHEWLKETLGGDAPRANSLVKVAQANRLLTSFGVGRGSPPLDMGDIKALVALALMSDGPTKAPEVVMPIMNLRMNFAGVDMGDGVLRVIRDPKKDADVVDFLARLSIQLSESILGYNEPLKDTLHGVLGGFVRRWEFQAHDLIELQKSGEGLSARIVLQGPERTKPNGIRGTGDNAYSVEFRYGTEGADTRRLSTVRRLGADALNALGLLSPFCTRGECDAPF